MKRDDRIRVICLLSVGLLNWVIRPFAIAGMASPDGAATSVVLAVSPNPSTLGQPVTLTATVSPSAATGRITFYDGATVLGTATVSSGQAILTTVLLPSGVRSLKAYYSGDATYAASASTKVALNTAALPQSGFHSAVNSAVGIRPRPLVTGDFNGDGKLDLAVGNLDGNNVSVLLGSGYGTFQTAAAYSTGVLPFSIAAGDFNQDSHTDLVVGNYNSHTVSLLLGNGNGTFQAAVNNNFGEFPSALAVADLNADGKLDLVVVSANPRVFLGNGDGTFQAGVAFGAAPYTSTLTVGDFNGDDKPDLAVGGVSVLLGNSDGTFQAAVNYYAGCWPQTVATADFNADGKADLVVVNDGELPNLFVLMGNGDGTFQAATSYNAWSAPASVRSSDFGELVIPATCNFPTDGANAVVVGDFNGDGKPDLAVVDDGTVRMCMSSRAGATGPFRLPLRSTPAPFPVLRPWAILTATAAPTWPFPIKTATT